MLRQVGNHARKWDRSGAVVEVRSSDQYVVKVDGSSVSKEVYNAPVLPGGGATILQWSV